MKIALVSDSHYRPGISRYPAMFWQLLSEVDLILHAGDIGAPVFAEDMRTYAPVEAVAGNCDGFDLARRFGYKKALKAGGLCIGLCHSHLVSHPYAMLREDFFAEPVDAVVYGHTHVAEAEWVEGKLLINPGSISRPRGGKAPSCGLLRIDDRGMLQYELIYF